MIKYLKDAVFEVFENTIGEPVELNSTKIENGYISKIKVISPRENELIGVFKKETLEEIAKVLFFEDNPDENTIIDLSKELMNLFLGNSKTIASRHNEHFIISTPEFVGIGHIKENGNSLGFSFRGHEFTLYA